MLMHHISCHALQYCLFDLYPIFWVKSHLASWSAVCVSRYLAEWMAGCSCFNGCIPTQMVESDSRIVKMIVGCEVVCHVCRLVFAHLLC